jgi:hypothetical protein
MFECACGKTLRVPQPPGVPTAVRPNATPALGAGAEAEPALEAGANVEPASKVGFTPGSPGKVATIKPAVTPPPIQTKRVQQNGSTGSAKLDGEDKKLAPFVIKPRTEPMSQENWNFDEVPTFGFGRIVWEDAKFFSRLALPYCVVIGLLVAGFVYRVELQATVGGIHAELVQRMRPVPDELEMPVDAAEIVKSLRVETNSDVGDGTAAGKETEPSMAVDAANRAIQANVVISIQGQRDGAGVVCGIVGTDALILTNRSSVDQMFFLTAGDQVSDELPSVNIAYANNTKSVGEVVWVADGKIDLAIIKAECLGRIQPVRRRLGNLIAQNDRVFYVAPALAVDELIETKITQVMEEPTDSVSVVKVNVSAQDVPMGSGLYSENGELVAIQGAGRLAGTGSAIHVSVLEALKPAALLNQ